ncbi:IS66-like element accessory protein TnpA [Affinirhizobium pseudoryzae]|uniref:IS66-like element accessory protein TnpA n=1 Tax=Allorhizobium pseudoryzae TaxID=379684 RepID=UPI001F296C3C|nr:transposase [Allorhizobium pseudoryzae]
MSDDERFVLHDADDGHQHHAQDSSDRSGRSARRVEVIIGGNQRRRWTVEDKARITAASFMPGANIAAVAREHGVSQGLLHYWRRCARERVSDEQEMRFVPVVTRDDEEPVARTDERLTMRVDVGGASVLIECSVDERALRTVFSALRGSA